MPISSNSIKKEAFKLVYRQLIAIMVLALIVFLIQGMRGGVSTLLGGLAYVIPNLFFVWRVFRYNTARTAIRFVIAFFAGEIAKLFLSAILFVLIVKYLPVQVVSVLVGFIGAIMSFWVISILYLYKHQEIEQ